MVLPLYLAMTRQEMEAAPALPRHLGIFGPPGPEMPPEAMLILTDQSPIRDPAAIAAEAKRLHCRSVLLDFEKKPDAEAIRVTNELSRALPCPVAAPPGFAEDSGCPVFLPPCPLHVPLAEYLRPWQGREIWLDVTMRQQAITVTPDGTRYSAPAPADRQTGGWFDEALLCRCMMEISDDQVDFLLFETPDTLTAKLDQAAALGVTRAVGLYQELYDKLSFSVQSFCRAGS